MVSEHQKPIESGFQAKSEPSDILAGIDLAGKTAIVTGGYSGIGFETVRALAGAGAHVHVPARDVARARETLVNILPAAQVSEMDLSDVKSVGRFVDEFTAAHDSLDILIANAGVMACPERRTAQGWEWQFGVNHVGHFVLGLGMMDLMAKADGARLVTLSSIGHRMSGMRFDDMHFTRDPYEKWTAYGQSKTAQALFATGLNARMNARGVEAFSVHPGGIFTPLQRHLPTEEMAALGWTDETGKPSERAAALFKTPAQGATTSLWCATNPRLAGKGGVYCEDCDIAALVADDDASMAGVRGWAVDEGAADKLWDATERLLAEA